MTKEHTPCQVFASGDNGDSILYSSQPVHDATHSFHDLDVGDINVHSMGGSHNDTCPVNELNEIQPVVNNLNSTPTIRAAVSRSAHALTKEKDFYS